MLYRVDENFGFFLKKYALYTGAICHTLGYTLMPNPFHFAIKIKSLQECIAHFEKVKDISFDPSRHNLPDFLMERFSNLCNSYTKSYNKFYDRKGALFNDYMKRIEIDSDRYFCNLVNYIHFNSVHHGFCKTPFDWKWTSFHAFIAQKKTKLRTQEVLEKFGGINEFKLFHGRMVEALLEYEFL